MPRKIVKCWRCDNELTVPDNNPPMIKCPRCGSYVDTSQLTSYPAIRDRIESCPPSTTSK